MKSILGSLCALLVAASWSPCRGADEPATMYVVQFWIIERPWSGKPDVVEIKTLTADEAERQTKSTSPDVHVLSRPRIATVEGAEAYFQGGSGVLYVVGYADGVPQTEQEHQGRTLCFVPHAIDAKHVRLEINYQTARIVGMRKREVPGALGDKPGVIEKPLVQRTLFDVDVEAEIGGTTMVQGILDRTSDGKPCETRIVMRVDRK